MDRHLTPRYGHVILVSGYSFLKLSIDYNMDMQYQVAASHTN